MFKIVRRVVLATFAALAASGAWPSTSSAALNSYIVMGPEGAYYFLSQADVDRIQREPDKPPPCKKPDCLIFLFADGEAGVNVADLEPYAIIGEDGKDASETLAKAIPDEALLAEVGQAIKEGQIIGPGYAAELEQLGIGVVTASWPPPESP
jgi:hypothetical protein